MKSYEIISLPFFDGEGKISQIKPTFDYILHDEFSNKVFGIFSSELQSCELFYAVKICYQIKLHIDEQNCEIGVFTNSSVFGCSIRKTNETFFLGNALLFLGFQYFHFNVVVMFSVPPRCTILVRVQKYSQGMAEWKTNECRSTRSDMQQAHT